MSKFILILAAFMLFAVPGAGFCEDARIDNVSIAYSPDVRVSFLVKEAFTKEIEEAIKSGIPTSFKFIVELDRVNTIWFNEQVGYLEFRHTVKYDSFKEEYEVTLEESSGKPVKTKDFGEMKKLMDTTSFVDIKTTSPLVKGEEYEIRIMAELHAIELPFILKYMLFFVKIWDFNTGWFTYRFTP